MFEGAAGAFAFISGIGFHPVGGISKDFDSKAMRKVEDGDQMISVVEASSLSEGVIIDVMFRQLIKLH